LHPPLQDHNKAFGDDKIEGEGPLPPMNRSSNGELLFSDNDEKYAPHSTFAQTPKVGVRAARHAALQTTKYVPKYIYRGQHHAIHKQQQWRMNDGVGASTAVFSRTTRVASVAVRLANARLRGHSIHKQSNHDHHSSETRARHPEHGSLFKQSACKKSTKKKNLATTFFVIITTKVDKIFFVLSSLVTMASMDVVDRPKCANDGCTNFTAAPGARA